MEAKDTVMNPIPKHKMDYEILERQAEITWPLAQAEMCKQVGEWFERQLAPEDTWVILGRKSIDSLKQGKPLVPVRKE